MTAAVSSRYPKHSTGGGGGSLDKQVRRVGWADKDKDKLLDRQRVGGWGVCVCGGGGMWRGEGEK